MHRARTWLTFVAAALCVGALGQSTQRVLYVVNNVGDSITVFHVGTDGLLTQFGDPVPTGSDPQAIALSPDGKYLALVHAGISTMEQVWLYSVAADGGLTPVAAPAAMVGDGPLDMHWSNWGHLFIPCAGDDVMYVFKESGGTLVAVPGSPFGAGSFPLEVDTRPDGRFVFVSNMLAPSGIMAFTVNEDGSIQLVTESPVPIDGDAPFEVRVDAYGDHLYVGTGLTNTIDAFDILENGDLSRVTGAPFPSNGTSAVNLAISPFDTVLFCANVVSDTVTSKVVNADGSLSSVPGGSQSVGNDVRKVVTDGEYVYVTDESSIEDGTGVLVYRIEATGRLTRLTADPVATNGGRPQAMVLWRPTVISGTVTLADYSGPLEGLPLTIELRRGWWLATYTTTLDASGSYFVLTGQLGVVDVVAKVSHWLSVVEPDVTLGSDLTLNLDLPYNGDANQDDSIDLVDINQILTRFGTVDPDTDLDGSGLVDLPDLNLVLVNFGREGEG